uniref:Uncharacterized protein n=1 Tax=Trichoplax adhaerens TaxID=10228 RepID=Q1AGW9_TRIAD|nr:hypothetical protein [Trichoplax adhaerens]ABF48519.1 unknown [Trichoplax adhaerens]
MLAMGTFTKINYFLFLIISLWAKKNGPLVRGELSDPCRANPNKKDWDPLDPPPPPPQQLTDQSPLVGRSVGAEGAQRYLLGGPPEGRRCPPGDGGEIPRPILLVGIPHGLRDKEFWKSSGGLSRESPFFWPPAAPELRTSPNQDGVRSSPGESLGPAWDPLDRRLRRP